MLSQEENELLARVGPGAPAGPVQTGEDPLGINTDPEKDEVISLIPAGYTAFSHEAEA